MTEIKTIGIIGMGTIGTSISYILQEAGLNVIGFKHKNRKSEAYKELIKKDKIVIINSADNTSFPKKTPLKIQITSSLEEIAEKADLILNCCRFPQNSTMYQFSETEKSIIKKRIRQF
ncbi:NAD(P)-dependent oxidoreductase [Tenacibaculum pacificus]|uniref:NAD(P)-dependent oxidoreductase n=1 Tax=Tenacibaculum pacificus TaxID=3018314 RepID=UPI0022F397F2|nr:NAD(P)-dependent oxidoreductase [Tenacibaculum pacificus]WBX73612.1 NAD(P)-dependent oxidoreductase [Tenacibaculum pacificus]